MDLLDIMLVTVYYKYFFSFNLDLFSRPSIPKVMGMKGLSSQDSKDLETIATFKKKMADNKKKSDIVVTESSKLSRLGPTIPKEFHFATDDRLRNQKKATDSETYPETSAHISSKPTKLGPTKPQEFNFATDSRIKNQAPIEENETVEFTRSLRSSTTNVSMFIFSEQLITENCHCSMRSII